MKPMPASQYALPDHEGAEQLFGAAIGINDLEFVSHGRVSQAGAGSQHERSRAIGGLSQFDVADIGQVKNALDLQSELAGIQPPEPLAKALTIAVVDLRHPLIDGPNVAAVVEVELRQCQQQRDDRAEEQDANEKAPSDAAAQLRQGAPCRRDAP